MWGARNPEARSFVQDLAVVILTMHMPIVPTFHPTFVAKQEGFLAFSTRSRPKASTRHCVRRGLAGKSLALFGIEAGTRG